MGKWWDRFGFVTPERTKNRLSRDKLKLENSWATKIETLICMRKISLLPNINNQDFKNLDFYADLLFQNRLIAQI